MASGLQQSSTVILSGYYLIQAGRHGPRLELIFKPLFEDTVAPGVNGDKPDTELGSSLLVTGGVIVSELGIRNSLSGYFRLTTALWEALALLGPFHVWCN